jgi:hypothetical protein
LEGQFYDPHRGVMHARTRFVSAGSSSAFGRARANSLQIVRVVELGPSPANPSAIVTEDRRYPCPHLGTCLPRDASPSLCAHTQY